MVFSSVIFLQFFLPIFLVFYFVSPFKWKNAVALLGSCVFYSWGEPLFFLLVLFSLYLDFYLVRLMYYSEGKLRKNLLLWLIVFNLLILFVFKYLAFGWENMGRIASLFGSEPFKHIYIVLPIGVSFITFQKISYIWDVYKEKKPPLERFVNYGLYILFFPQLIAGPIIRFHEIVDQLHDRRAQETIDNKLLGFQRFIIGLAKKVLIANPLGLFVDEVFSVVPESLGMGLAWLGIIAYSFQLYFDFSGYSDMAIGLGRMMGFRLPENFQFPYISQSITEFWRRWHITLSNWMRDYLYIPLGGNRVSPKRLYVNLWTVFLLSGLWHGARWNFVIWGAFHGAFLVMERSFLLRRMQSWPKGLRILSTYVIVLMGWVFFRSEDGNYALRYIVRMFSFQSDQSVAGMDSYTLVLMLVAAFFSFVGIGKNVETRVQKFLTESPSLRGFAFQYLGVLVLGVLSLWAMYGTGFNPFIYFRF